MRDDPAQRSAKQGASPSLLPRAWVWLCLAAPLPALAEGGALPLHSRLTTSSMQSVAPLPAALSPLLPTAHTRLQGRLCGEFSPVASLPVFTAPGQSVLFPTAKRATGTAQSRTSKSFVMPVEGARMSSNFGSRRHPIRRVSHRHDGIDFAAPKGTPVVAAADGKVTFIGAQRRGFGNYIVIAHRYDSETLYAHLSATARDLRVGDLVKAGDHIGAVGQTGMATGPHLHFELRRNGDPVDPKPLLTRGTIKAIGGGTSAGQASGKDDCQSVAPAAPAWQVHWQPHGPATSIGTSGRVGGARWNFAPM
ncbi:M23 family metallopeptidase [Pandoraea sp. ISTKB]|uniref:M23 family metallopeptidase n=1 Tax=Pandoraea sp. ISTKB TaxID=1586708 RepID=UPI00147A9FE8|nr:M23 family metallopeptidase [Pandoraea sp. ISTKB]